MRLMLISNNWTLFLGYLEWPEQLRKRHLKPIPKTNHCFVLFYIWIGGNPNIKGERSTGTEVLKKGKVSPTESSGVLVLSVQNLACRELWLNYFHEPQKNWFSFLLTQDDYTEMITQYHQHNRWLLLLPWEKKLSCGPSHLLLQFLAVPASGF